jgi:hypothetical protein
VRQFQKLRSFVSRAIFGQPNVDAVTSLRI